MRWEKQEEEEKAEEEEERQAHSTTGRSILQPTGTFYNQAPCGTEHSTTRATEVANNFNTLGITPAP